VELIKLDCPPAALLDALVGYEDPVFLDSAALHQEHGRYSVLTCCPTEVLTLREGKLTNRAGDVLADNDESIWRTLHNAFSAVRIDNRQSTIDNPYSPGWFGYLGYELGRHVERLPGRALRDTNLGDLRLGFHDAVLVYDALDKRWELIELTLDGRGDGGGRAVQALREIISNADPTSGEAYPVTTESADATARPISDAASNFSPDEYKRAVAQCVDYIAAGDIFQVNLSQRFTVADAPDPLAIYHALRGRSPAFNAAYLGFVANGERCAVLSSSPELFLRVRGDRVITRPIKGTRPRVGNLEDDEAAIADLLASPKDNAELAMIVDLLRNDLGRVCSYGSLSVVEPRRLETHPTVFHLVATIEGYLHGDAGIAELLHATFPGGSITGAPKIRAMEIIDELEPFARGVYTGCIGTVGVTGNSEWNIAIRTIVCDAGRAHIQVGGGIVADSSPEGEYSETLDKARAMLEAVAAARVSV
jgi:para-aminobenzoate synthetase component 1